MRLAACIASYLFANNGNRPRLLTRALEPDATVTPEVQTDQIITIAEMICLPPR